MSALRKFRREVRAWLRIDVLLITSGFFALAALLVGPTVKQWWHARQRDQHLAAAQAAMGRRDFLAALEEVRQGAAATTSKDPALLRTAVIALCGLNAPPDEILNMLRQIEALGGMTPEMYLRRAEAQLSRGDLPAVRQALDALPVNERQSWAAVEIEATLLLRQDRAAEAARRVKSTVKVDSPNESFRRAVLDLTLSEGQPRAEARRIVWQTARGDTSNQLLAITVLSREADLTAREADELLELAGKKPAVATIGLRYAVLAQVFRLSPERKTALIDIESRRAASEPCEQQVDFLLFLAKHHAPQAMSAFLFRHGQALAKERPADFVNLKLEAMAKERDWEAVSRTLATKAAHHHLSPMSLHLWEACTAAARAAESPAVLEHLNQAYHATHDGLDHVGAMRVADTAINLGQAGFAAACYEEIAAKQTLPGESIRMLEKALYAHSVAHSTRGLCRVARALAEQTPGNRDNTYRADYLGILCGLDIDIITRRLQTDLASPANDPAVRPRQRLLEAMLLGRMGQTVMLPRALEGLEKAISWNAGERAVLAGLLVKAGEPARAWALVEKLPESLLLPEEAALAKTAR